MSLLKTQETFATYAEDTFNEVLLPTLRIKGEEYTGQELPVHWNFTSRAKLLNMHPPHVIVSDVSKQISGIAKWSGSLGLDMAQKIGDQIRERIDDVIIYMLLLRFWLA